MGGPGSGRRWHKDAKETTTDYRTLDIRNLQRDGMLNPGTTFITEWLRNGEVFASSRGRAEADQILFSYRYRRDDKNWQDYSYPIRLDWSPCYYGGQRAWFLCPHCGRRVAILYSDAVWACRKCYRLAYPSQREAKHDRLMRKANKIRSRLTWAPGALNGLGEKPKGMRWRSYELLSALHEKYVALSQTDFFRRFGIFPTMENLRRTLLG